MQLLVHVSTPNGEIRKFWLRPGQVVRVGRSDQADQSFAEDSSMSGMHFELECVGESCLVRDLRSTNGTFVNEQRVSESIVLQHGSTIRAGTMIFRIQIEGGSRRLDNTDGSTVQMSGSDRESSAPREQVAAAKDRLTRATVKIEPPVEPPVEPSIEPPQERSGVTLIASTGAMPEKSIWLKPGQTLLVGRSHQADSVFAHDLRMSGSHFEVRYREASCRVRNLGSANGTLLNDVSIEEAEIVDGDVIKAGTTTFRVQATGLKPVGPERVIKTSTARRQSIPGVASHAMRGRDVIAVERFRCRSKLFLYRGADSKIDPGRIVKQLQSVGTPLVVIAAAQAKSALDQYPNALALAALAEGSDSESVGTDKKAAGSAVELVSPVMLPELEYLELSQQLVAGRGTNALCCFFARIPMEAAQSHLQEFISQHRGPETVGLAALQPQELSDWLANDDEHAVATFFRPFAAILVEIHGGDRWGLFTSKNFDAVLSQRGFALSGP